MSENNDSEQVLESSRAVENDDGDEVKEGPLDHNHVIQTTLEESSVNQEPGYLHMNHVDSKEDMFVDAPDELIGYDGRNADGREATVTKETPEEVLEEIHYTREIQFNVKDNGLQENYLVDELQRLQATLQKTADEKESIEREYKEEKETFVRVLANLHCQLRALTDQHPLPGDYNDELVDGLLKDEIGESEEKTLVDGTPLHEMINECSNFLKSALEERLQTESTIRELHAVLYMKDQEIEDLGAKIMELSVSHDVAASYITSVQKIWSQSAEESLEVQLEKDHHIEVVTDRMLASLAMVFNLEELLDNSVSGKITNVEKNTSLLIEKYNQILHEIYQLRQCLSKAEPDIGMQEEFGTVLVAACDELVEFKRREAELVEKLSHLEDENRKLFEQVGQDRVVVETVNAELGKTKMELEQEKAKCANTKEKLTLAVTKGKALVQQRDSLKQSLANKTNELEKHLTELQEKSSALEAAELFKGELVKWENLVASLQETLKQRDAMLVKLEDTLSHTSVPEELQSVNIIERLEWLVDEINGLKNISLEFYKLKDALSLFDLPDSVSSSDLESRVHWLKESFYQAKDETNMLQDEIARTREAARIEIDRLSASLLVELQEKDYIQQELDALACKYEQSVERTHQVSLEKDEMVRMLLEGSGITMEDQEGVYRTSSDLAILIDRCFGKIRELTSASFDTYHADAELYERIQSLLYVRDQELMLCEKLLEEEMLVRSQVNNLLNELRLASQEVVTLKEEKGSLQNDLERSEEKCALLREKLSMAVKKGKGLVQDRENMKLLLNGKNSEIEKLKLELQKQETTVDECRDQINKLSTDLERIPQFEADLLAMKDQRDQLEQFLLESNNMLQRVIESIDSIVLPVDSTFEEPVQKVNWIARYINECQHSKTQAEQELGKVEEEASFLGSKLAEAQATIKSLEEALSVAENKVSQLAEEKREMEVCKENVEQELQKAKDAEQELGKVEEEASFLGSKLVEAQATIKLLEDALSVAENRVSQLAEEKRVMEVGKENVEQELQKAKEEAYSQNSEFAEACATRKSLEDALSLAENNISMLINEKEEAQVSRAATETELEKVREEVAIQTSTLAEAYETIKSLEGALSQVESNVALLTKQNNDAQVGRTNLENEMKKLQDEAESQAGMLADARTTIRSLEDALSKSQNDISDLEGKKNFAGQEIVTLKSKLTACMEELAGKNGNLESRSVEFIGHLSDLQMLVKDESLLSTLKHCFEKKFESLKDMDLILKNIGDHFLEMGSGALQSHLVMEEDSYMTKPFTDDLDNVVNVEMENSEVKAVNGDNISLYFRKTAEGFQLRNKIILDKFEGFSASFDNFLASLLRKLQATRDEVIRMFEHVESLKQTVKNMELYKQEQEKSIAMLKDNVTHLHSACADATRELQFEVKNSLLELSSVPELEKLNNNFPEVREVGGDDTAEHGQRLDGDKYFNTVEKLLFTARKVQTLTKLFEGTSNVAAATIEDMQKKLKETRTCLEEAIEERDLNQNRVSKLENEVEALQIFCKELRVKVEDYQAEQNRLKEKEAELSSLYNSLLMKEQDAEDSLLSPSQVRTLLDKISGIEIPFAESEVGESGPHSSADVKKLFYIIDNVTELQYQVNLLSHDKEKLQSTLSTQILEIERLKEEVGTHIRNKLESEKMKRELSELTFGLENIIHLLRGNESVGDQKSAGVRGLLLVLEKQVMALLLDAQNSKSEAQELITKLLGNQKVVDELSTKVKLLEDSLQSRTTQPEIVQERSIFEAPALPTGSEISEIEDVGSQGKNTISPVPSAAHVRTMRKGSTDHLALNIDLESARLINNEETDEDKGHVFKSLNTSGLIPKQGKLMADRIDGIWVSGGRVLMSRPGARLGLIAYWLVLHIWLLGTIL